MFARTRDAMQRAIYILAPFGLGILIAFGNAR